MNILIILLIFFITEILCFENIIEDFNNDNNADRWIQSVHGGKTYGKFIRIQNRGSSDEIQDKGIQTVSDYSRYAYSTKFDKAFSNINRSFVLQFEVRYTKSSNCAGGYIKILPDTFNPKIFYRETPYLIMFGPDRCDWNKGIVHVILQYKNEYYPIREKLKCPNDTESHIYTLIIRKNCSFEILIDYKIIVKGLIGDFFDMLPPKEIEDLSIKMPNDWENEEYIDDPSDQKPTSWNDLEHIADPNIVKPSDWDNNIDGIWKQPNIDNPNYSGKWAPKKILNKKFKHKWVQPKKLNPNYIFDKNLYKFNTIGGIGIDLWQVDSGTMFDNIIITSSEKFAKKYASKIKRSLLQYNNRKNDTPNDTFSPRSASTEL